MEYIWLITIDNLTTPLYQQTLQRIKQLIINVANKISQKAVKLTC
jgi:hypothetical protein